MRMARIFVMICIACFCFALLYWFAVANTGDICGVWCSGWGGPPPSDEAVCQCLKGCWEALR